MNDDLQTIIMLVKQMVFLLKVLCIACSFTAGILLVKLMIHTKNQRDLI